MVTGPMKKESIFQQLKEQTKAISPVPVDLWPDTRLRAAHCNDTPAAESKGSFLAYHGSAVGNWHCILRQGLKSFSRTKYMTHGASFGPGVYFSPRFETGLRYATTGAGGGDGGICWQKSQLFTPSTKCVALCEVIDRMHEFTGSTDVVVVNNEDYIAARLFLVGAPLECTTTIDHEVMSSILHGNGTSS